MAKRQARIRKGKGKGKGKGKDKGKAEEPTQGLGRMEDLDNNMLLQIFAKLSLMDLVIRISGVCSSWRSVCSEPSDLWKSLDLEKFKSFFNSKKYSDGKNELGLMSFKKALNLGGRHAEKLIFDHSPDVTDELLIFAAQRCQGLKEIMLPSSYFCTSQGLTRALEFWRSLESLTLEFYFCDCRYNIFQVIGANCKNLTTLRLRSCVFYHEVAASLAESVPGLKVLTLRCADIEKQAAEVLLDKLENLEELYLSLSPTSSKTPFAEPRFLPPLKDEAMIQKITKLREFHFCIGYCMPCIAVTMGESYLQALNLPPPI